MEDWCIRLASAIIKSAIDDLDFLKSNNAHARTVGQSAYEFLYGKDLEIYCDALGISAGYIRRKISEFFPKKACLVADVATHRA